MPQYDTVCKRSRTKGGNITRMYLQLILAKNYDAGHLLFGLCAYDLLQKGIQLHHSFWVMIHTNRADLTALFIDDQGIMMLAWPVYTGIPHEQCSSLQEWLPPIPCPYTVACDRATLS